MLVTFKETNYKTVEVPDNSTLRDLENMLLDNTVIVGDTTDTTYEVLKENETEWHTIC